MFLEKSVTTSSFNSLLETTKGLIESLKNRFSKFWKIETRGTVNLHLSVTVSSTLDEDVPSICIAYSLSFFLISVTMVESIINRLIVVIVKFIQV